ncbi:13106_t:CDS:2, partial [Racocetra persica]
FSLTIGSIHGVQLQMVPMIQDIQKKLDEMYSDWKAVGFGVQMKNDTKWIEDAISQTIYGLIEKVKYPSDKCLMQVYYDALLDMKGEGFTNKIKHGGWKRFFNKHVRTP